LNSILVINSGSSSIKFGLFGFNDRLQPLLSGELSNMGTANSSMVLEDFSSNQIFRHEIELANLAASINYLIDFLNERNVLTSVNAIGHRIVYGKSHIQPEQVTPESMKELEQLIAYDPDHMPGAIQLIKAFEKRLPDVEQFACFDTSFHATMPVAARLFPIPRRYYENGIQRNGFHGLSYQYLLEELGKEKDTAELPRKIIFGHLGSGASLAAVKNGKSIDTSMGFTPASGIPMSTRTGDLDPGIAWYLMQSEKMNAEQFNHLINHESGLLGISQTSSDIRELLKNQYTDHRAAEAIEVFCYQIKKWIGAFAAALGGLDALVFSGGIGENAPEIRSRICHDLAFLGIELDNIKNDKNESFISSGTGKVIVRVIKTNEQLMIARLVWKVMKYGH
jgi:acetate kinase